MDQPVQYCVGNGRVSNDVMPFLRWNLTGDEGGREAVAIFKNLQEISSFLVIEFCQPPVIDDQQGISSETGKEFSVTAVTAGNIKFLKQPGQPDVMGAVTVSAGTVGKGTGNEGLAAAGMTRDDHVLFFRYPVVLYQGKDDFSGKPPRRPEVDFFGAGMGITQPCALQEFCKTTVVPDCHLPVDEEPDSLLEGKSGVLCALTLLGECLGHAGEFHPVKFRQRGLQHHWAPPA